AEVAAARVCWVLRRRRAVEGDVDPPVVAGCRPSEDVVVEPGGRNRHRLRPCLALASGEAVLQNGVAGDLPAGVDRRLLPDGVEVPRLVDGHRREVGAGLEAGEARHWQVDAVETARV